MKFQIYLDICCLNRPFDDLRQDRIRLEAEAIKAILHRIDGGQWEGVESPAITYEILRMPDMDRMLEVGLIAERMQIKVSPTLDVRSRAVMLENMGFGALDAVHLAFAEKAKANVFLTSDDALQKRARRCQESLEVLVDNPLRWFEREVRK